MCKELKCLPRAGGILDQDSYQVWLMQIVLSAWAEKANREADKNKPKAPHK